MSDTASKMLLLVTVLTTFISACLITAGLSKGVTSALEARRLHGEQTEGRIVLIRKTVDIQQVSGSQAMQSIRLNLENGIAVQIDGKKYDVYSDPYEPEVSDLSARAIYTIQQERDEAGNLLGIRFRKAGAT